MFAKEKDREVQRATARKRKADRNKQILSMYATTSTQEKIADKLDISQRTVCNVLQDVGARKCDVRRGSNKAINPMDDKKRSLIYRKELK